MLMSMHASSAAQSQERFGGTALALALRKQGTQEESKSLEISPMNRQPELLRRRLLY
jgi:hypothetical protein